MAQKFESFPEVVIRKPLGIQVSDQLLVDLLPLSVPIHQQDHPAIFCREVMAEFIEGLAGMDLENGALESQCPQATYILISLHNNGNFTIDFNQARDEKLKLSDPLSIFHGVSLYHISIRLKLTLKGKSW